MILLLSIFSEHPKYNRYSLQNGIWFAKLRTVRVLPTIEAIKESAVSGGCYWERCRNADEMRLSFAPVGLI